MRNTRTIEAARAAAAGVALTAALWLAACGPGGVGNADADDAGIVVYCERGGRAAQATDLLLSAGFRNLSHLEGDMSGWRADDLPIER